VKADSERLLERDFEHVEGDVISRNSFARHDATREAALLMEILVSTLAPDNFLLKKQKG
jgi:hypothetical protein